MVVKQASKKTPSRKYPLPDVKILWGLAAARCAFPKCRRECVAEATEVDSAVTLGIVAHIYGHSSDGPRPNGTMTLKELDCYENWILLCGSCHSTIDGQENYYTAERLQALKDDHENWVRLQLAGQMPDVTFAELEIITRAISIPASLGNISFIITDPARKMQKNNLTEAVHFSLTMGIAKAGEVEQFLQRMSKLYPDFAERLKAGFVAEYNRLVNEEGLSGDRLFEVLQVFAGSPTRSFKLQAAGLAVLAYLFQACEVFEP